MCRRRRSTRRCRPVAWDIDGVAVDWPGPGGVPGEAASWSRVLNRDITWTSDGMLDRAGTRGVVKAAAAISAGLCDVAVVGGGQCLTRVSGTRSAWGNGTLEFTDVWGAYVYSLPLLAFDRGAAHARVRHDTPAAGRGGG